MKVKDLIIELQKLDQEKEIKVVKAGGYEYEEWTEEDIEIVKYEDTKRETVTKGKYYYPVDDCTTNKDFYLLQ